MPLIKKYHTCPLRTLEIERLAAYLEDNNIDATLIGACVVTKQVEQMVVDSIRNSEGEIILIGCVSNRLRDEVSGNKRATILTTIQINKYFTEGSATYKGIEQTMIANTYEAEDLCNRQYDQIARLSQTAIQRLFHPKTKIPFLVIARGCNCNCSFCHSRFYIGKLKSKSIDAITTEYLRLIKKHSFINIIAEDIGSYGEDINVSLPYLLKTLDAIPRTENVRWMLDGLQPNSCINFKEALIPLFRKQRINAMSVAVQSGSERILKLMNREANVDEFINTIKQIKCANKKIVLQGIFIIGFPSETEQDFQDTVNLILRCGFEDVTLIPYSEFSICESSNINEKIEEDLKFKRINYAEKHLNSCGIRTRR